MKKIMKVWLSHLFIRLFIVIISSWTNYFIQGHNFWKYEKLENCYPGRRLRRERDFQRLKRNWSLFGFDQNSIFLLDHSGLKALFQFENLKQRQNESMRKICSQYIRTKSFVNYSSSFNNEKIESSKWRKSNGWFLWYCRTKKISFSWKHLL